MSTNASQTLELQEDEVRPKKKTSRRGARGKGASEKHRVVHDSSYRENSAERRDRDINVRDLLEFEAVTRWQRKVRSRLHIHKEQYTHN